MLYVSHVRDNADIKWDSEIAGTVKDFLKLKCASRTNFVIKQRAATNIQRNSVTFSVHNNNNIVEASNEH